MTCQDLAQALFTWIGLFLPGVLVGLISGPPLANALKRRKEERG